MTTVFISGSMKIKQLDRNVLERLQNIIDSAHAVVVGDADGVDSAVQKYFETRGTRSVVVYCTGPKPRNNIGDWETKSVESAAEPGTRAYFTAKDKAMAADCDCGLMVWDTRSAGTLSNTLELVSRGKASLIYINKAKTFLKVKNVRDLEQLLTYMDETSLRKADEKIGLLRTVDALKFTQNDMFSSRAARNSS